MKNIFTGTNSLRRHLRLYISLGLTAVVYWFIRGHYSAAFTFMLCWISFSVTLLFFLWTIIVTNHPRDMAIVASEEDSSRMVIFLFSLVAAVASLFAIILLLQSAPDSSKSGLSSHILLAAAAVGASWTTHSYVVCHTVCTHVLQLFYPRRKKTKAAFRRTHFSR